MRFNNWIKNVLIFLPILSSHNFAIDYWKGSILIFFIFSLSASSMYILNDIFDYEKDLLNSSKKKRPLTSGELSKKNALIFFFILQLLVSSYLIFIQMEKLLIFCMVYNFVSFLYTIKLKKIKFLDTFIIASFFVYRVLIGAEFNNLETSVWIINFIFFLFLALVFLKRYSELNSSFIEKSNLVKVRPYSEIDKNHIIIYSLISFGISAVLLINYFALDKMTVLYSNRTLLFYIPPIYFTCCLILFNKIINNKLIDDPINYCLKLKSSWFFMIIIVGIIILSV